MCEHEIERQKTYECEEFDKTFKNKVTLRSHIKIVLEGKRIKCPEKQWKLISKLFMRERNHIFAQFVITVFTKKATGKNTCKQLMILRKP